jgi:hypothetical protein
MYSDLEKFVTYLEQDIEKLKQPSNKDIKYLIEIEISARLKLIEDELLIVPETNDDKIAELEGQQRKDWLYFAIVLPLVISLSIAYALVIMTATTATTLGILAFFGVPCILAFVYLSLTNTGYEMYERSAQIKALKKSQNIEKSQDLVQKIQDLKNQYQNLLKEIKLRQPVEQVVKELKLNRQCVLWTGHHTTFKPNYRHIKRDYLQLLKIPKTGNPYESDTKYLIMYIEEKYRQSQRCYENFDRSCQIKKERIANTPEKTVIFSKLTVMITGGLLVGVVGLTYLSPAFVFPIIPLLLISFIQKTLLSVGLFSEYRKYQALNKEDQQYLEPYYKIKTRIIEKKLMYDYAMEIKEAEPSTLAR